MLLSMKDGALKHMPSMVACHHHQLLDGQVDGFWGALTPELAQAWRPLKLMEADRTMLLQSDSRFAIEQGEKEIVQLHLQTAQETGNPARMQPFGQERFSNSCYSLDLLVPCNELEPLYQLRSLGEDSTSVLIHVPLLRLKELPHRNNLSFPVLASQLIVMETLCDLYLQPQLPERIIWHRPLQMLEEKV
eukprot:TRINITY_DN12540_c2_g2_i2.p1 TRINITY_DN12540_c2_g2~~TRINITY_DN12540_c2_g2_i2.p1  ORF type:complete len:190 (+),score=28.02 TRINITY_DN12540_c2_g2_i2:497-1066(+)